MPFSCHFFDQLPVELVHNLFNYFVAHEILLTFTDLSDYVNSILQSYSAYKLFFKSIRKADFDRVCRLVRPEQVMSLTLSDDKSTPGQSQLFFSHFHIEQFTQLRSLTLLEMIPETLEMIFPYLSKLHLLRSLSVDYPGYDFYERNHSFWKSSLLSNNYVAVTSRLNSLHLYNEKLLISTLQPCLYSLKQRIPLFDDLKTIFQNAPRLRSLDVSFDAWSWRSEITLPANRLTRLYLQIEPSTFPYHADKNITMDKLEHFLIQIPCLQHLNLNIIGSVNLCDGYRWARLAKNLQTFHFLFSYAPQYSSIDEILRSFSTSFWLEEKNWIVGCNEPRMIYDCPHSRGIFSIPSSIMEVINPNDWFDFRTTKSNGNFIFEHVKTINLTTHRLKSNWYFPNIQTLHLKEPVIPSQIQFGIELNQIKHLHLQSIDQLINWTPLPVVVPQVCQLSIDYTVTMQMIERIRMHQFEQIRRLRLSPHEDNDDPTIELLFRLFPSVEEFFSTHSSKSEKVMFRCIDGFKRLQYAVFTGYFLIGTKKINLYQNISSNSGYLQTLHKSNFICRVYEPAYRESKYYIHWWIGEQAKEKHPLTLSSLEEGFTEKN